jgi:fused signal recognition particle receptor
MNFTGTLSASCTATTTPPRAVPLTGVVITKLDGTARGGVVVAVHEALNVPVKFIGTGEGADDLHVFDATEFAEAMFEG